jgi:hypothetical protein
MTARMSSVLFLVLALQTSATWACGHCAEDLIAAVYDHALAQRVAAQRHQIAFYAWEGPIARNDAARGKILALIESIPGVDRGSARLSMDPAVIAIAFDPRRRTQHEVETALQRKLDSLKLSILLLESPKAP